MVFVPSRRSPAETEADADSFVAVYRPFRVISIPRGDERATEELRNLRAANRTVRG